MTGSVCSAGVPSAEVLVGQDILELVTSAMYLDPLTIYREYIQNAADAIDEAVRAETLAPNESGRVEISLCREERTIRIRDNGTGIPLDLAARRLTAIGASTKRDMGARGFRGIGRLAGLGYCRELIFRTRASGADDVFEMSWDGHRLKEALRHGQNDTDLTALISEIVTVDRGAHDDLPERFFEVELRGILRHGNDALLNGEVVSQYLAEVAPVPFSPEFSFGQEIYSVISAYERPTVLEICIDGQDQPIYRPHCNAFPISDTVEDRFVDVEFLKFDGVEGDVAAIGWILHHGYKGAIPQRANIKGLRARMGNMQVGGTNLFEGCYPESRFNHWTVGEIHVVDRRVVPNGRRDQFEQNIHLKTLESHIAPLGRSIGRRCRESSIRRNALRALERQINDINESFELLKAEALSAARRKLIREAIKGSIHEMKHILKRKAVTAEEQKIWDARVENVEVELANMPQAVGQSAGLRRMSKTRRQTYQEVLDLIYECASSTGAAKALIQRIIARIQ